MKRTVWSRRGHRQMNDSCLAIEPFSCGEAAPVAGDLLSFSLPSWCRGLCSALPGPQLPLHLVPTRIRYLHPAAMQGALCNSTVMALLTHQSGMFRPHPLGRNCSAVAWRSSSSLQPWLGRGGCLCFSGSGLQLPPCLHPDVLGS